MSPRGPPKTAAGVRRLLSNIEYSLAIKKRNRLRGQQSPRFQANRERMKQIMGRISAEWGHQGAGRGKAGIEAYRAFVRQRLAGTRHV